ncbi:MAG: hypothetical protein GY870_12670 [archaeon]|nr:hypothetical protein [archaeon]
MGNVNRITCSIQNPASWGTDENFYDLPPTLYWDCNVWFSNKDEMEKYKDMMWHKGDYDKDFIANNYQSIIFNEGLNTEIIKVAFNGFDFGNFHRPMKCKSFLKKDQYFNMIQTLECSIADEPKYEPETKIEVKKTDSQRRRDIWDKWKNLSKRGVSKEYLDNILKELDDL